METEIAKYYINDTFFITDRGIVFVGYIVEGFVKPGSYIEFPAFNQILVRKIIGVESINSKNPKTTNGLLIQCKDEIEMKELRNLKPSKITAIIKQIDDETDRING